MLAKQFQFSKILLVIFILLFSLTGCSRTKDTSDGYKEVIKLTGNSDAHSPYYTINSNQIRVKYKTSGISQTGIDCQIVDKDEKVKGAFGTGPKALESSDNFEVDPGEYAIIVSSKGLNYEVIVEEKVTAKN
ncbi:MAG: hypothetical protein AWM53_01691 [Candidatus Dichloromethanomonas elyunquensis]|nr:MAG: hypothetical protein AWM53_01691 [Candidatus Dichloromethanomonas elyunquensis]